MNIKEACAMICFVPLLFSFVCFLILTRMTNKAKLGYENHDGFHYGEPDYDDWWTKKLFMKQCPKCREYYIKDHICG